MRLITFVQVSDRQDVNGKPGLLVNLSFRIKDQLKALELEGVVSLNGDMEMMSLRVTRDELHLGDDTSRLLLHAAASAGWNAIYVEGMVATGFLWQSMTRWLTEPDPDVITAIEAKIIQALGQSS